MKVILVKELISLEVWVICMWGGEEKEELNVIFRFLFGVMRYIGDYDFLVFK